MARPYNGWDTEAEQRQRIHARHAVCDEVGIMATLPQTTTELIAQYGPHLHATASRWVAEARRP